MLFLRLMRPRRCSQTLRKNSCYSKKDLGRSIRASVSRVEVLEEFPGSFELVRSLLWQALLSPNFSEWYCIFSWVVGYPTANEFWWLRHLNESLRPRPQIWLPLQITCDRHLCLYDGSIRCVALLVWLCGKRTQTMTRMVCYVLHWELSWLLFGFRKGGVLNDYLHDKERLDHSLSENGSGAYLSIPRVTIIKVNGLADR